MNRNKDILKELEQISPVVAAAGMDNIFTVPEGYFDSIAPTVLASVNNEISVSGVLPEGYFDSLPGNILAKIEGTFAHELQQLSPLLSSIKKVNPFIVPDNYFDQTVEAFNLLKGEDELPAILENIQRKHPFGVPASYFEELPGKILASVKNAGGAKVIPLPKRSTAIWKYAAAAIFTCVIALGVYRYAGNTAVSTVTAMDENRFNQSLESLPEEDIIKYLERNGTQEDVAALTSVIEESDLPDQEDYFIDDATLEKFLEEIELKN